MNNMYDERIKEIFKKKYPIEPTPGKVGEGVPFERIRRITGYLVGDTSRFNNAKYAEQQDRVKHSFN